MQENKEIKLHLRKKKGNKRYTLEEEATPVGYITSLQRGMCVASGKEVKFV